MWFLSTASAFLQTAVPTYVTVMELESAGSIYRRQGERTKALKKIIFGVKIKILANFPEERERKA